MIGKCWCSGSGSIVISVVVVVVLLFVGLYIYNIINNNNNSNTHHHTHTHTHTHTLIHTHTHHHHHHHYHYSAYQSGSYTRCLKAAINLFNLPPITISGGGAVLILLAYIDWLSPSPLAIERLNDIELQLRSQNALGRC